MRLFVVDVGRHDRALLDAARDVGGDDLDAELMELAVLIRRLEREVHVGRDVPEVRHQRDVLSFTCQLLGERDPHEVAVVVDDEHAAARHFLVVAHDLLGSRAPRLRCVGAGDRVVRTAVESVADPVRAGGDNDDLGAILLDAVCVEGHPRDELDVPQLVDLDLAVVDEARPFAEPRKLRDPAHDPAHVFLGLDEVNAPHTAFAENHRALHPRRSGADDEHVVVGVLRRVELLRMPAAAVLLACGRVLCADHRWPADLPA